MVIGRVYPVVNLKRPPRTASVSANLQELSAVNIRTSAKAPRMMEGEGSGQDLDRRTSVTVLKLDGNGSNGRLGMKMS